MSEDSLKSEIDFLDGEVKRLKAERDALLADATRYRWLRQQYLGADFAWNSPPLCVLVFEYRGVGDTINNDLEATIDRAMETGI